MMRRIRVLAGSLLVLGMIVHASTARAQVTGPMQRIMTVSGEGIVRVLPDQAKIRFAVVTRNRDVEQARRRNAEDARDAINAVRKLGIDERKIRLEVLRIEPVYEWNPQLNRQEDRGFEATRQVLVEVDDLDKVPEIVARVIQQGANRLHGVTYEVKDRQGVSNDALREAVNVARQKADLMATAAGTRLGRVMQVTEQGYSFPIPRYERDVAVMAASKAEASPEPEAYAPGEIEVRANVQVVFELE